MFRSNLLEFVKGKSMIQKKQKGFGLRRLEQQIKCKHIFKPVV